MRAFVFALAISAAAAPAAGAPQRVASLNLCTDELLLALAPLGQIASVSYLSQSPSESALWRQARRYPANDGSVASVLALHPDLLLTMGGGARDRVGIAARLNIRTLAFPYSNSLEALKTSIIQLGGALGRQAEGRRLVERIDALQRSAPSARRDTIWLGAGGQTLSADGLGAQWMRLAGFAQRRIRGDRASLEQLLVRPPKVLLRSDYRSGQYSNAQRWLTHPLAGGLGRSHTIVTDGRRWTCMGPTLIPEIERLRR